MVGFGSMPEYIAESWKVRLLKCLDQQLAHRISLQNHSRNGNLRVRIGYAASLAELSLRLRVFVAA